MSKLKLRSSGRHLATGSDKKDAEAETEATSPRQNHPSYEEKSVKSYVPTFCVNRFTLCLNLSEEFHYSEN